MILHGLFIKENETIININTNPIFAIYGATDGWIYDISVSEPEVTQKDFGILILGKGPYGNSGVGIITNNIILS